MSNEVYRKRDGYDSRSKEILEDCEKNDPISDARELIKKDLIDSVTKLKSLTSSADDSVALSAIKHHLKLAGLEIDQAESVVEFKILPTQADAILSASKMVK